MHPIALFFSGGGGNALNLLRACREGRVPASPVLGVASTSKAGGIARLQAEGLPVVVLERREYADDAAYARACYAAVEAAGAQAICLCGWLKRLALEPAWEGRILNIHPALLPGYGGKGMYGMNVHRAVIAAGERESGCTVHLVDDRYDHGPVLAQARVPVLPGDTAEALQARVYEQEMALYPVALAVWVESLKG